MKPNFNAIKTYYGFMSESILSHRKDQYAIDPYAWEPFMRLTPIEDAMWGDFRCIGMVMYPQYPVGRYFVDFANPVAKVAIECDGKEFHLDFAADVARQREIEALGWTVYRFTGRQCKEAQPEQDEDDSGSTYRLLRMIASFHGIAQGCRLTEEVIAAPYLLDALAKTSPASNCQ